MPLISVTNIADVIIEGFKFELHWDLKNTGNEEFERKNYSEAIKFYKLSLEKSCPL